MTESTLDRGITVLCCRDVSGGIDPTHDAVRCDAGDSRPCAHDDVPGEALADLPGEVHCVGPRPGKAIDPLLNGRVLVLGDDADLNAVVLRLLRRDLLGEVEIAYAPDSSTDMTRRYSLPTGAGAVRLARSGAARPAPLVRNDAGGVLVGSARLAPITTPFFVDALRVPGGPPRVVRVRPDSDQGLLVTSTRRRAGLPLLRRREEFPGRAVEFGIRAGVRTTITYDGITHPRETKRWVFYAHTKPLLLVRR